jgi:hypothetical protein
MQSRRAVHLLGRYCHSRSACWLLKVPVCGVRSYRRGKPNSGDIDFTILAPLSYKETCKPLLNRILFHLRKIVRCAYPPTRDRLFSLH